MQEDSHNFIIPANRIVERVEINEWTSRSRRRTILYPPSG